VNIDALKKSIPGKLVLKFGEDKAINWATLIAWSGLLAMFPILITMASFLGFALRLANIDTAQLYRDIASAFPDQALQDQIFQALGAFKRQSGVFAIVGFVGLMFGGSAVFGSMEQAFAIIYHTRPRSFIKQKLLGFAMIIVFTVLAGFAVGTSSILPALKSLSFVPHFLTSGLAALALQVGLGVVTGFLLFAVMYYVVPNRRQEWAKVWPGALAAGVLFEVVTLVFPLYLELNKGISNYGKTFALFFMLMTFFYFVGIVTMVGVELNSVLYPIPVEQPEKAAALAPEGSGPAGEKHVVGAPSSSYGRNGGSPAADAGSASGGSATENGVVVLTPEMAEEANAGIAGLAAARERVGKARTLVGVGAIGWAVGMALGRRSATGRRGL
jgi:membrane protein